MAQLTSEIVTSTSSLDKGALIRLIGQSYGDRFLPAHSERLVDEASHLILLRNEQESLVACAVTQEQRIVSIGAEDPSPRKRGELAKAVLKVCYEENVGVWATIGLQYTHIIKLAQLVGMEQLNDVKQIEALLGIETTDQLEDRRKLVVPSIYDGMRQFKGGAIVINGPASRRPGYPQSVWAWTDRVGHLVSAEENTQ